MYLLSLVRMGVDLGRIKGLDLKTINEMFLMSQPAHLQRAAGHEMSPLQRGELRADYLRRMIDGAK